MRIKLLCLCSALLSSALLSAQFRDGDYRSLDDSETVAALKAHVGYLASAQMEGRKRGSEGEKMAARYIYETLSGYGVEMLTPKDGDEFGICEAQGDTLITRNVYGFVEGYDATLKNEFIVVGAHLDNLGTATMTIDGVPVEQIYYGANADASGLAILAELSRMVATNSILFRRSVLFAAFGASCPNFAGSYYFIDQCFKDKVTAMLNLDMLGVGDFMAYSASNADLNAVLNSLRGSLQPINPEITAAEPYPSDHRSFYAKEIPSIMFTTGRYSEHNSAKDTPSLLDYELMERETEYIYNLVQTLANSGKELLFDPSQRSEVKKGYSEPGVVSYYDCDVKPMFSNNPDINKFMNDWVYRLLKYPQAAVDRGIQGTVQVNFVVDKTGVVRDVKVVRGVDPLLDDEAVKVIEASPKWRAGRVRGEKVSSSLTVGVEFRLRRKGEGRRFGINGY